MNPEDELSRDVHVVPIDDLREHVCSPDCWCNPVQDDEEPHLYTHNALDGREAYEDGIRKYQ